LTGAGPGFNREKSGERLVNSVDFRNKGFYSSMLKAIPLTTAIGELGRQVAKQLIKDILG
jgi:hypothetical protein